MTIEQKFYEAYRDSEIMHMHPKEDLVFACSKKDFDLYKAHMIEVMNIKTGVCAFVNSLTYSGIELKILDTDAPKIILK